MAGVGATSNAIPRRLREASRIHAGEHVTGMISGTRGLLSIGARLSIAGTTLTADDFRNSMIELGVNAAIIIALGATLRIMGDRAQADDIDSDFAPPPLHKQKAAPAPPVAHHSARAPEAAPASVVSLYLKSRVVWRRDTSLW